MTRPTPGRYTRERDEGTWHLFARLPKALQRPVRRAAKAAGLPINAWLAQVLEDVTFCAKYPPRP